MKNEDWYDDAPMDKTPQDRVARELSVLSPLSEWVTFNELLEIREMLAPGPKGE